LSFYYHKVKKIFFYEYKKNLHVTKVVDGALRSEGIEQADQILVVNNLHDAELAVGALGMRRILKRLAHLLDSHIGLEHVVEGGADHALRARSDRLQILVALEHAEHRVAANVRVVELLVALVAHVHARRDAVKVAEYPVWYQIDTVRVDVTVVVGISSPVHFTSSR
jgi:hypothetical protein